MEKGAPITPWTSPADRDLNRENFYSTLETSFTTFEVQIAAWTEEAYRDAYTCADAAKDKNVVYLYRSEREVSRLVGASDILYIGQTRNSFARRYAPWARKHATIQRNRHALELYGPVRLSVCDYSVFGKTLREAESQLLWWYYQNHFEYPPFNYTRATDPSK